MSAAGSSSSAHWTTATAVVGEISVGFDMVGRGPDTLLLIHGHPFDRTMWRPQGSIAAQSGWRLIAPDLRGYGETTVVPGKTPLDVFAADLAALLDHLQIESVVVAGLSMGGQVAMEFARQFPARVRGLVLAATFPRAESDEGKHARNTMADRLLREGMHVYASEVLPRMLAARSIERLPEVARHVHAMMHRTDPAGAAAALRGRAERPAYEGTLATLKVPALIVVGSEDAFTTRQDAEQMRSLVRESEVLWLHGVGHMPNLESAGQFNGALVAFLNGIGTRQKPNGSKPPDR